MATKKASATIDGSDLTIAFAHGEELSLSAGELSNEIKTRALMHGLKQKVCDSFAGLKTPQEALEKASAVVEALLNGDWTTRTEGEGSPRVTQLARALSMVLGKPIEEAVEVISGLSDERKKLLGKNKDIKVAIAKIREEEARRAAEEAEDEGPSLGDIMDGEVEEVA